MERFRSRASYNNANLSLPPKPPVSPQASLSRRIHDAAEIGVFDAERYFNGLADRDGAAAVRSIKKNGASAGVAAEDSDFVSGAADVPRGSSASSVVSSYSRTRSCRAAPTASSEASWNSQTGLLANPPGAVRVRSYPLNETKKGSGGSCAGSFRGGRSFFGRHCPCYGKKSVDVEETRRSTRSHCASNAGHGFPKMEVGVLGRSNGSSTVPKKKETVEMVMTKFKILATEPGIYALPEAHHRVGRRNVISSGAIGGSFSFPVLISPAAAAAPLAKELEPLEPARESLEVFRPSEELARAPAPKPPEVRRTVVLHEDDMASDASSDLFELESLSANSSAYRRRDSLEELPKLASTAAAGAGLMLQFRRSLEESAAPSECYAPSEASVEWSVATAEAGFDRTSVANFSSAASDCGEARFVARAEKERSVSNGNDGGALKKRGGGGLLSCRCEKAVSVGPNPVWFGPDQQRLVAGPAVVPGPVPLNRSA